MLGLLQRSVFLGVLAVAVAVLLPAAAQADVTLTVGDAQVNVPVQGVDVAAGATADGLSVTADAGAVTAEVAAGAGGVDAHAAAARPDRVAVQAAASNVTAAATAEPAGGEVSAAAGATHAAVATPRVEHPSTPSTSVAPAAHRAAAPDVPEPTAPTPVAAPQERPAVTPTAAPALIGQQARQRVRDVRLERSVGGARHVLLSSGSVAPPTDHHPRRSAARDTAPVPTAQAPSAAPAESPFAGLVAAIDATAAAVASRGGGVAPLAILVLLAFAGVLLARGPRLADIAVSAPAAPFLGRLAPPG